MEVSKMNKFLKNIFSSVKKIYMKKYGMCSYELEEFMSNIHKKEVD